MVLRAFLYVSLHFKEDFPGLGQTGLHLCGVPRLLIDNSDLNLSMGAMYVDLHKSTLRDDSPSNPIRRSHALMNHDRDSCVGSFTVHHVVIPRRIFHLVGNPGFTLNYDVILTVSLLCPSTNLLYGSPPAFHVMIVRRG